MREYGLIGYPLSHSFFRAIFFTEKFRHENIPAKFYAFAIPGIDAFSRHF